MDKQNLNSYIEQLETLRELESRKLILREVAIKHQDRVVTEMLEAISGKATSERKKEDFSSQQDIAPTSVQPSSRDYIFISYSHKDKKWLQMIQLFFAPLVDQGKIHLWSDIQLLPGAAWREEIKKALTCAKVAILLVSADFLASDFIKMYELPPLLRAAEQKGLIILWIAVNHCLYMETDIVNYQAVNDPNKPLKVIKNSQLDRELLFVCERIKKALEQ